MIGSAHTAPPILPPYEDKQKWGKDTVMTPYMPDYAERDLPTRMDYYNRGE